MKTISHRKFPDRLNNELLPHEYRGRLSDGEREVTQTMFISYLNWFKKDNQEVDLPFMLQEIAKEVGVLDLLLIQRMMWRINGNLDILIKRSNEMPQQKGPVIIWLPNTPLEDEDRYLDSYVAGWEFHPQMFNSPRIQPAHQLKRLEHTGLLIPVSSLTAEPERRFYDSITPQIQTPAQH